MEGPEGLPLRCLVEAELRAGCFGEQPTAPGEKWRGLGGRATGPVSQGAMKLGLASALALPSPTSGARPSPPWLFCGQSLSGLAGEVSTETAMATSSWAAVVQAS